MLAAYPTGTLYNYLCARELEVAAIHPIPTEVRGVLAAVYLKAENEMPLAFLFEFFPFQNSKIKKLILLGFS